MTQAHHKTSPISASAASQPFMDTGLALFGGLPYKVRDLSAETVRFGRKELELALVEMPGLAALRKEHAGKRPLAGAKIMGSLHMTVQTAVLIETLIGARRRGALGVLQHLLDPGPRRLGHGRGPRWRRRCAQGPVPVFAWKGETLEEEYWWCTLQSIKPWPDGSPNLILDDGGDATLMIHRGLPSRRGSRAIWTEQLPRPRGRARGCSPCCDDRSPTSARDNSWHRPIAADDSRPVRGDHHRCPPPLASSRRRPAPCKTCRPSTSTTRVTKSKFDNIYGCRALPGRCHHARHRCTSSPARSPWCAASATWARARCQSLRGQSAQGRGHRDRPHLRPAGGA